MSILHGFCDLCSKIAILWSEFGFCVIRFCGLALTKVHNRQFWPRQGTFLVRMLCGWGGCGRKVGPRGWFVRFRVSFFALQVRFYTCLGRGDLWLYGSLGYLSWLCACLWVLSPLDLHSVVLCIQSLSTKGPCSLWSRSRGLGTETVRLPLYWASVAVRLKSVWLRPWFAADFF